MVVWLRLQAHHSQVLRRILRDPASLAALGLTGLATLAPGSGQGGWGLGFPDPADLLVNIALFVPLGVATRLRMGQGRARQGRARQARARQASPLRVALLTALVLSTAMELAQLSLIPGRDSSPWDLAANVSGAVLGASLPAHHLVLPLIPAWLLSGWLLAPAPPPTPIWWGQWAHQFGSPAPFSGTVRAAALNAVPVPDHSLGGSATAQIKAGYQTPPSVLTIDLDPPVEPSPGRVQVAGIADGAGGEVVGLWQSGWDLELRWHSRGTLGGLRHPAIRAPGVLEGLAQPEATISAFLEPGHAFIEITSNRTFGVSLGPWQGWRLFWPTDPPGPGPAMVLSVLWTGVCLGVPLMLWVPSLLGTRRKPH